MDNARNPPLELGLERDHIAPVPLGDQLFLQVHGVVGVVDDVVQLALQPVERDAHLAAHRGKPGAGRVHDLAGFVQHTRDLVLERGAFFQPLDDARQPGKLPVHPANEAAQGRRLPQRGADGEQGLRFEQDAALRSQRVRAHVTRTAHGDVIVRRDQHPRFMGFLLAFLGLVKIGRGGQAQRQFAAGRKGREPRQLL